MSSAVNDTTGLSIAILGIVFAVGHSRRFDDCPTKNYFGEIFLDLLPDERWCRIARVGRFAAQVVGRIDRRSGITVKWSGRLVFQFPKRERRAEAVDKLQEDGNEKIYT